MTVILPFYNKQIYRTLSVLICCFIGYAAFAQNNDPLEKRTTLYVQNQPLEQVLNTITKQTGVRFSYNSKLFNSKTKVSISVQNKTLKTVLPQILPLNIAYKKLGEHIIFYANPSEEKENSIDSVSLIEKKEIQLQIAKIEMEIAKANMQFAAQDTQSVEQDYIVQNTQIVVQNGQIVLQDGQITLQDGQTVVQDGKTILQDGKNVVQDRQIVVQDKQIFVRGGQIIVQDGQIIVQDAHIVQNGQIVVQGGQIVVQDGQTVVQDGKIVVQDGQIVVQDKQIVVQDKQIVVQDTQIVIQDTQIVIQDKQIIVQDTQTVTNSKPFRFALIHTWGTNGAKSVENTYHFAINILGGKIGQIKGLEIGGLWNINKYGARGMQIAGLFNFTNANNPKIYSNNAQFSGIFNCTKQGKSLQFASIFNMGDMARFQLSGIFNVANKAVVQFAGFANIAQEPKCQITVIANTAKKSGCQIAGFANTAEESKCQLAGIVNITSKGRFQAGLINIRDTADGVSLGLINIVKQGGIMEAGIEAGEFVHTSLMLRSGVQRLYSILSVGWSYTDNFFTFGTGLGANFKLIGNLSLNLELTEALLYSIDFHSFTQYNPVFNYRFANHFKIYLGPSFNLLIYQTTDETVKPPYNIGSGYFGNSKLDMWIGLVGGIRF